MSFTGEFHHTIDAKGRLIVPARIRDSFPDDRVVLCMWFEDSVAAWGSEQWRVLEESLQSLNRADAKARTLQRHIFGTAHHDVIDKQGRINVPQTLRDRGGITRDVVVIGAGDHAEIWDPQRLEQARALGAGELEDLASGLQF